MTDLSLNAVKDQETPIPDVGAIQESPTSAQPAGEGATASSASGDPSEAKGTIADPRDARIAELEMTLAAAAARYRDLAARSNPDVPAELITGTTIDQVDQSIEAGKAVVAKVRAQLAAHATSVITPGAPVRTGPDVDALSALDKIKYAVSRRNAKH